MTHNSIVRRLGRVARDALILFFIALLVGAGVLYWRLTQGPINLALLKAPLEAALTDARGGREVAMNRATLEWSTDRLRVEIVMTDLVLHADQERIAATAKTASVSLKALPLLFGRIEPLTLRLEKGRAHVGNADLDRTQFAGWPALVAALHRPLLDQSFQRIELADFTVLIGESADKPDWQAKPVKAVIRAQNGGFAITASAQLIEASAASTATTNDPGPNPIDIDMSVFIGPDASSRADRIHISNIAPDRLGPLIPARWRGIYQGLADVELSYTATATALETVGARVSASDGHLAWKKISLPFESVAADFTYSVPTRHAEIASLSVTGPVVQGVFSGTIDISTSGSPEAGAKNALVPLSGISLSGELKGSDIQVTSKMFAQAVHLDRLEMRGAFKAADNSLDITSVRLGRGTLEAEGFGRLYWRKINDAFRPGMTFTANGTSEALDVAEVLALWPLALAHDGRSWVARYVDAGAGTRFSLAINCRPDAWTGIAPPLACIDFNFDYENVVIKDIFTFPPLTGLAGTGRLADGVVTMRFDTGAIGSWTLESGQYQTRQLLLPDQPHEIRGTLSGDLPGLEVILAGILPLDCRLPELRRPLAGSGKLNAGIDIYPPKDDAGTTFDISVDGTLHDVASFNLLPGMDLTKANIAMTIHNDAFALKGSGLFDNSAVDLEWTSLADGTERIAQASFLQPQALPAPGKLTASLRLSTDQLEAAGLRSASFMSGEVMVKLDARRRDCHVDTASAQLDLKEAQLDLPLPGWSKPKGEPASGAVRFGRDSSGASVVSADIRGDGLSLSGDASLDPDGNLRLLVLENIHARDQVDLSGQILPLAAGGYKIDLSGSVFDAGKYLERLTKNTFAPETPIEVSLAVASLKKGRNDVVLKDSSIQIKADRNGLQNARVSGKISREGDFKLTLKTLVEKSADGTDIVKKNIKLRGDDAGRTLNILTGAKFLRDGEILATGVIQPDQSAFLIRIHKTWAKDLPLLATILSLASLRGLFDSLGDKGILFTNVEIPIRILEDRIELINMRASGSSLGITGSGWLFTKTGEISLDGLIVPSFGINAALGGIPIVGDLFVSRPGEGVFAIGYTVRGTLDDAQTKIEPLKALTPGILRRAFENSAQPPPQSSPTLAPGRPQPPAAGQ